MASHARPLTLADMVWLPDVFVPYGIILSPVVSTMIGKGQGMGGWWGRTFLGFGTFQCGYWPDVADVGLWLIPDTAAAHPRAVLRLLRDTMTQWEAEYYIRRWQSLVVAGWPQGERLIALAGFTYEGTLRECEPGVDYAMYGRIRKG